MTMLVCSEAAHNDCVGLVDLYSSDSVKNPGCSVSAPPAAPSVSGLIRVFFLKKSFCGGRIALACESCCTWEAELCSLGLP